MEGYSKEELQKAREELARKLNLFIQSMRELPPEKKALLNAYFFEQFKEENKKP